MSGSLFNRHRPHRFADLIGQEAVAAALRSAVHHGRAAAAYLFSGPQGTGKTSAARVLARALNCAQRVEGEPCGVCPSCTTDQVDVIEMDAASNRGIDDIRALREQVNLAPLGGGKRVFILDEAHQITGEAFNALLKTLEEPPAHAVFILATTEPSKVPPTIQSRCQHFAFRRVGPDALITHIGRVAEQEGMTCELPALEAIARASQGGVRDALVLLEQAANLGSMVVRAADVQAIVGGVGEERLRRVLAAYAARDLARVFAEIEEVARSGADGEDALHELTELVRADLGHAVRERAATARPLFTLLEELARAGDLVIAPDLAFVPIELAFFRAIEGAGAPATPSAAPASAPPAARTSTASTPSTPRVSASPAAAPNTAAASAAAPAAPAFDLEAVRAAWKRLPDLLNAAKQIDAAQMCAGALFPEEVRGDQITVGADGKLSFNWLQNDTRKALLARTLGQVLGRPVRISTRSAPSAPPASTAPVASAGRAPAAQPGADYDRFAGRVSRFFEAETE